MLSLVIQVLLLAAPLFLQITVDQIGRYRGISLEVVAFGFAVVIILHGLNVWARSLLTRRASLVLDSQLVGELFRHWIKLPMSWFQHWHMCGIVSQFQSVRAVRDLLANGMITGLSDVVSAVVSIVMLTIYLVQLAAIVFTGLLETILIRALFYGKVKEQEDLAISAAARAEQFPETVRAIQTIKASAHEAVRERRWHERLEEMLAEETKVHDLNKTPSQTSRK